MKRAKNSGFIVLAMLTAFVLFFTGCDNGSTGGDSVPGNTGTPSTAWYTANPSAVNFTISSANDLAGLAEIVNAGTDDFSGDK